MTKVFRSRKLTGLLCAAIVGGAAPFLLAAVAQSQRSKTAGDSAKAKSVARDAPADKSKPSAFATTVRPFLKSYCVGCHGGKKPKADRRFDTLSGEIENDDSLLDYQDVLDQLNLGKMPPKTARQPSLAQRRKAIAWLTRRIARYHRTRKRTTAGTALRRLNAREYRNTVRDLLRLDMTMFDPTAAFPRDRTSQHLDNVADTLVTSGHLLAKYLTAADQSVNKALFSLKKPAVQTWTFRDGFRQQPEIDQVHRKTNRFRHMTLYDVIGADKHEGAYGPILAFKEGVPYDGLYEIRLKAEAVNRLHPYDQKFLGTDRGEPLRLGIVAGNYRAGALHKPQPMEPLLAEQDLADEQKWYTVRVRLDKGFTPRFTFRNGLMDVRRLWGRLVRKYPDQFPKPRRRGIVADRFNAIKYGKLPHIRIHEIEIKGPIYESWPTASQQAVLGEDCERILRTGSISAKQVRKQLTAFASQAYRRPARKDEIDRIMKVIAARQAAGRTSLEAFGDGLKAVLCSPGFLYFDPSTDRELSPHALATRLSYFLWSTMPDAELRNLAAKDQLRNPRILAAQVDRMLKDAKSDAFIDGFLDSWLTLRDLGATPPERRRFAAYYHYDLGTAMRRETHLFTRHLIDRNLSVANFLDSDFTFVNKPLARFYGLKPPKGPGFHRVKLTDRRRGGLLGQASVLTVTANGIDTSPVVRGVWLLENILGTPPTPPPPDVEPLDPDIRGAKTIRDQLRKHRSVATCNDCHRKIDPLGFALENFDPIGNWRTQYGRRGAKVDASGELPTGESFKDVAGLKRILVRQKPQFAKALTEKLLAYAIGRHTTAADRPEIDRIVAESAKRGDGLRDLIRLVATGPTFRLK